MGNKGKALAALVAGGIASFLLLMKKGTTTTTTTTPPGPEAPLGYCKVGEWGIVCTSTTAIGGNPQRYCYGSKLAAESAILDMAQIGYSCFLD